MNQQQDAKKPYWVIGLGSPASGSVVMEQDAPTAAFGLKPEQQPPMPLDEGRFSNGHRRRLPSSIVERVIGLGTPIQA
jgi:hypothetical protein